MLYGDGEDTLSPVLLDEVMVALGEDMDEDFE